MNYINSEKLYFILRHFRATKKLSTGIFFFFIFLFSNTVLAQWPGVSFHFNLSADSKTSAGVYTKDGTMIRTLWSGVSYKTGSYTMNWDGRDDDGHLSADGKYDIKVLSNNVTSTWEGVVGNTSNEFTGETVHRGWDDIKSMVCVGKTCYYSKAHSEGSPSHIKFSQGDVQRRTVILPDAKTSQNALHVVSDGINVYWGGSDGFLSTGKEFVVATKVSDDREVVFSSGTTTKLSQGGYTYDNAIDITLGTNAKISGLAVQKKGDYLFVAHGGLNQLQVLNKTTGSLVQTIKVTAPMKMCVDGEDNLWMISGDKSTLSKYPVNQNGTLGDPALTLSGLTKPLAVDVSPLTGAILVADGADKQQLRNYLPDGSLQWVYGQEGGYVKDATVANDKFLFTDNSKFATSTFICFQEDGSFWVGDTGNSRSMHFLANRDYIEQIMFLRKSYSCNVDKNNPTRVFSDFLEFEIDYSKTLDNGANGSWKLIKNWGATISADYREQNNNLKQVATLNNKRTYATVRSTTTGRTELVELVPNGTLRLTGITLGTDGLWQLYPDGSMRKTYKVSVGQAEKFSKRTLVSFDAANNPIWDSEQIIASTPITTSDDPIYYGNQIKLRSGEITSSNIVVAFDGSKASTKYHLGGMRPGDNKWLWRTAVNTNSNYNGPFPADGAYDIGNGVNTTGIAQQVEGRIILWGYHGEFWKASQTNKYTLVYDNGLFLTTFGVTRIEVDNLGLAVPQAGMAGNAFSGTLVKVGEDLYYYHNDENYHSGVHRWKISGLNSIQEQVIGVDFSAEKGGLTGFYFDADDLNNLTLKNTRIDPQLNFSWGKEIPGGTSITRADTYSVRWKGFVETSLSEEHTLYLKADKGVRLWVDNKLYVDKWTNEAATEFSSALPLETGKRYAIRIEAKGGSVLAFSWSSPHQPKTLIPSQSLYPSVDDEQFIKGDLLYGLTYNSALQNNLYGWKRDPVAEDYADASRDWWQVFNGRKSYRIDSPDLWVKFRQPSGSYTVTRDLGVVPTSTSWSLIGRINYEDNEGNISTGGVFLEVLDKNNRIIARTYTNISYTGQRPLSVFGNAAQIASAPMTEMWPVIDQAQPINITADSTGISFTYAQYPTIKTTVFDPASDWHSPKTMRLYFFGGGTSSFNRIIDIESMRFVSSGDPANGTEAKLNIYPNPTQSFLTIEHPTIQGNGALSVFSVDGRKLMNFALADKSSKTILDVNSLPVAIYVIEFEGSGKRSSARFIKR
ncbi:PA14 domain-containing protein [Spirosoma sp. KNUC1025]|uniref:PA14 domain-containing protein n=1 Tax=Spirosoma sp. KNUC1025 TaxID=2894082 RepID=UPI0038634E1E|nr:T9SS type A sorting domain-containing protein [Spirosoma sp. KNUC1025]